MCSCATRRRALNAGDVAWSAFAVCWHVAILPRTGSSIGRIHSFIRSNGMSSFNPARMFRVVTAIEERWVAAPCD